jgi:hypothetical protein
MFWGVAGGEIGRREAVGGGGKRRGRKGEGVRTLCNQVSLRLRDDRCQAEKGNNYWLILSCYVARAGIWEVAR